MNGKETKGNETNSKETNGKETNGKGNEWQRNKSQCNERRGNDRLRVVEFSVFMAYSRLLQTRRPCDVQVDGLLKEPAVSTKPLVFLPYSSVPRFSWRSLKLAVWIQREAIEAIEWLFVSMYVYVERRDRAFNAPYKFTVESQWRATGEPRRAAIQEPRLAAHPDEQWSSTIGEQMQKPSEKSIRHDLNIAYKLSANFGCSRLTANR